jgi:23S rRNA G2445 N2-methylase RlmL
LPDFYVPAMDLYVDVKGAFFDELHKEKFDWIKKSNPDINIYLLTKKEFLSLGIDVTKESKSVQSAISKKPAK